VKRHWHATTSRVSFSRWSKSPLETHRIELLAYRCRPSGDNSCSARVLISRRTGLYLVHQVVANKGAGALADQLQPSLLGSAADDVV
jgi:hypothetical protein